MVTKEIDRQMSENGWAIVPGYYSSAEMDKINVALNKSLSLRQKLLKEKGLEANNEGTAHHLIADDEAYLDLLETFTRMDEYITHYFDGKYIINSYGGIDNRKSSKAYVKNMHRDVRSFTGPIKMMLNILIMLDDFTLENGATYLLSGSHLKPERPDENVFYAKADRAVGKKGDILLFDSQTWHATGNNITDHSRRALTITLTKPNFKQQADYPRMVGYDRMDGLSPYQQQVIGYYSRVPANLDEYFQPVESRFYRRGQE